MEERHEEAVFPALDRTGTKVKRHNSLGIALGSLCVYSSVQFSTQAIHNPAIPSLAKSSHDGGYELNKLT